MPVWILILGLSLLGLGHAARAADPLARVGEEAVWFEWMPRAGPQAAQFLGSAQAHNLGVVAVEWIAPQASKLEALLPFAKKALSRLP